MKVKLLGNTRAPERKRLSDAGYDFYLNSDVILKARSTTVINTGVCVELPEGTVGHIVLRSSSAVKGLIATDVLVDCNYRGELHGIVYNSTNGDLLFHEGDRLYSLYITDVKTFPIEIVEDLSTSERGNNWNGSSNNPVNLKK